MNRLFSLLRNHRFWLVFACIVIAFWSLPVVDISPPYAKIILDREGVLLSAQIAKDEQWRFPPTTDRHPKFEAALLRMEDKRFYEHIGIDFWAIGRALHLNWKHRRIKSGASTLTMQVVRIAQNNPPRRFSEKIWEMLLALRLEIARNKEEILLLYTHNAPFGGNIVGIEAASWRYFGRPPQDLSWAESAMLAVLPNNPALIHISRNRDALKRKRDILLHKLCDDGLFPKEDLSLFLLEPIPPQPKVLPQKVLHLLSSIPKDQWRVQTTLDNHLQNKVDTIVQAHAKEMAQNQIHNVAALMIDISSGDVLAYVGNTGDFHHANHGNHVDIVHAPRSTGSLLKPFLYYAMLSAGELLPNEIVPDIPMSIGGFSPKNYDKSFQGALGADIALARSRNIPAAWMLKQYGVNRWYSELKSWGMTTLHRKPDDYGLALILGGAEGTLWDLARMYHNLAWSVEEQQNGGILPSMHWNTIDAGKSPIAPMKGHISWLVVQALKKVHRPSQSRIIGNKEGNIAWKTGTSYGFRDAWSIGFTPQTLVAVWVGNADGEGRADLTGQKAAAPLFFDLLELRRTSDEFALPHKNIIVREICSASGLPASENCAHTILGKLPQEAEEHPPCHYCTQIYCNENCSLRMDSRCAQISAIHREKRFLLPPLMEAFYANQNIGYQKIPPWAPACSTLDNPLELVFPRDNAHIFVPIDLNGTKGRVVFEATHRQSNAVVHWHLDEQYITSTIDIHQVSITPEAGEHVLTIVDQDGNTLVRRFIVEEPH